MVKRNQLSPPQPSPPIEDQCKSLIKNLASCKQTIRDRSLRTVLRTWLPEQTSIPDESMKKLWQGLFYCLWHADKSLYQSELIDRLAAALQSLPLPLSLHYFAVFLFTMRREWSRIDRLRLDKFYLLIRRFLNGFFEIMDGSTCDLELTRRLMGVLFDGTFFAGDRFNGSGVLVGKIKSCLFDELLKNGKRLVEVKKCGGDGGVCEEEEDDVVVLGSVALSMEFGKRFYEMGSSPDCCQGNRKVIFEEFLQLGKDVLASGIEVSVMEGSRRCEDQVPELVPIEGDGLNAVSVSKKKNGLKKCSKSKKDADAVNHGKKDTSCQEAMISDLQQEFEKIASEMGPVKDEVASVCEEAEPVSVAKKSKKRKREDKGVVGQGNRDAAESGLPGPSSEESSKRVRFSLKNNVVWKPHCPLPPKYLRLPPSATPRGSALKKGIPAGPVREFCQSRKTKKKVKPSTLNEREERRSTILEMTNHRRAPSFNPTTEEDNAMFLDILHEAPLFGHRESRSLVGSCIYLLILASYAVLAAGAPLILQPVQSLIPSLLCSCNVALLMLTGMFQQYFVNQVQKIRLQGYYSFSQKLKHVVRLPFAIMAYGTASMLLFMVWRPYVSVLPILTVQRFIMSVEAISAASFMIVFVGYVRQYNSVNSQPDVLNSLYSPLQPAALEGLRYHEAGRLSDQQMALLQYQRENLHYLSEEILRLQESLSKYEESNGTSTPQVDLAHLVATRDQELRTLSAEVDQLHSELNLARSLIAERDREIQHVRNTNNQYVAENERLRAILGEWSMRAAKLERALEVERITNVELRKKVSGLREQRQMQ
ncbi:unnamed protein product [Brassica napus]|uniref:(rape) hypothetical protein n=1 Tax=Brassica napus TaxID=3708 RepID=A0A816I2E7_BRANA|nr:unnamed protein product [Brassica napus]